MKLSQIKETVAADDTPYTFSVLDPNGEPYRAANGDDATWSVLGRQSKARRKAEDTETRRVLRLQQKHIEPADIKNRRIALALACSVGFTGWEDDTGAPIPFTPEHARAILEADVRILEQVEEAIDKHSAFLSMPYRDSSPG
jgi:hypothetical protein